MTEGSEECPYPNHIRYYIRRQGYSIQEAARKIGIPRRTFTDYVIGVRPMPREGLKRLARLLKCSVSDLLSEQPFSRSQPSQSTINISTTANVLTPPEQQVPVLLDSEIHMVSEARRKILQDIASTVGTVVVAPQEVLAIESWNRLSKAVNTQSSLDETTLDDLESINQHYERMHLVLSSHDLLAGTLGHLGTITHLLKYPHVTPLHRRLCSIATTSSRMIGLISFDLNMYNVAQNYYDMSLQTAQHVEDHTAYAVSLGRKSFVATYNRQLQDAHDMLQEAQKRAAYEANPLVCSWLSVVEAEVLARMHRKSACLRTLERAETFIAQQKAWQDDMYAIHVNLLTLLGYKGVCYLQFAQPKMARQAEQVLTEALGAIPPSRIRHRAVILADLAAAYLQQKEVEQACKTATQVLTLMHQTRSLMVVRRIVDLRKAMARWQSTSYVKDFDKYLFSTYQSIAS
ncbi:MAG: helix-turn-helix transcriptional regulator [Ktedonobacteraceae bacterium]|nr:helix-turn-helix transcriptional regulator [Ktedonobacteraceae bacterium]